MIWLHDVRSTYNVGSIFRIADALGFRKVLLSGFTPTPPSEKITKTALGAEKSVDWIYFNSVDEGLQYINNEGHSLIALEQTSVSVSLEIVTSLKTPFCLVAGSEIVGVADDILNKAPLHVHINQFGKKHSLNISVAVGIALYSLTRSS